MGRRCCVVGCPSTSRLPEHHGVTYHSFPLDTVIRAIWIKNSRISLERQITKSVLVCSRHFRRLDFHTIRNGKYLLKPRVFPTVFPWGKMEASEIEADHRALQQATMDNPVVTSTENNSANEEVIKATVDAIVTQIFAESTDRSTIDATSISKSEPETNSTVECEKETSTSAFTVPENTAQLSVSKESTFPEVKLQLASTALKYGPLTNVTVGARLEAQNSEGTWQPARIVEVNETDQTLLIRFDRNHKQRPSATASISNQEWLTMSSDRLRQRVNTRLLPVFEVEEKCMARWSGPRKFPGTVKKALGNDTYEVLFDDGYTKNVRAVHMNKLPKQLTEPINEDSVSATLGNNSKRSYMGSVAIGSNNKKNKMSAQRKDWPLLDMNSLDLAALGLPEIPHDGEWTCHWVNDQPIGTEGFLIVGEHHKPTVIVQDWRLPPGWIKHMYQRSNVLGKWDVILVSPSGKRFRSKSDLKQFLESQNFVYNPDIYDFSIHRRRAKDINAYVYTHDYNPQQPKVLDTSLQTSATFEAPIKKMSSLVRTSPSTISNKRGIEQVEYMQAPIASLVPPAELMSPQVTAIGDAALESDKASSMLIPTLEEHNDTVLQNGYAFIGGLKVNITDNLFVCPREGCGKTFRKEDFLQIHIRHYHKEFAEHVSHCPKMQELAVKRAHPSSIEQTDGTPKNQIPNQQFFAKLHQQDLQQSRTFRRQTGTGSSPIVIAPISTSPRQLSSKSLCSPKSETASTNLTSTVPPLLPTSTDVNSEPTQNKEVKVPKSIPRRPIKRSRLTSVRRFSSSRRSHRQRSQRSRYVKMLEPAATINDEVSPQKTTPGVDSDKVRLSEAKKCRVPSATTLISSIASPLISEPVSTPTSSDQADINAVVQVPQYIKENGELIRIVRMRQEEIINCICDYGEEDGLMIQCELCLCWQHGACNSIVRESDVPEKYVCYICRNPQRVRESMRFVHDQDWLFEGRLPSANFHVQNTIATKPFELLKRSHTLTGNLIDAKRSLHSLMVKINIAKKRSHPKLYLWAKRWDGDQSDRSDTPIKNPKTENLDMPNVPQPEAAIDPEECQFRLIEHIKSQQNTVLNRLSDIEMEMNKLEKDDFECHDFKDLDISASKDALNIFIKELEAVKRLVNLNNVVNMKQSLKEQESASIVLT